MTRFSFVLVIVTACVSVFAVVGFAQNQKANGGTLRGTITDTTQAQNPIEGVTVKIITPDGKEWTTTTDANGEYKRANLPIGRYIISLYKRGYNERIAKPVTIVDEGDHPVHLKMLKKDNTEKRFSEGLIQHVAENIGERYNLKEPVVAALHQSIHEALNTALEQMNRDVSEFATTGKEGSTGLLTGLLSHSDCRAAFAKHLTETQLQDYIDFIKTLRQRDQQVVAQRITAWFDKELSLTTDQRKNVEQLILDTTENESFPVAINILEIDLRETVNLAHERLEISLDGILSQAQSKIWQNLVNTNWRTKSNGIIPSVLESQVWQLAEAKLERHTELLGPLDENASRHLAVATKGVLQQHFETRDKEAETMFHKVEAVLMRLVLDGVMEREEATEELNDMRRELGNEKGVIRRQLPNNTDITKHPLYQQAIKDVLSNEAFRQYKEIQAERESFHLQVLRRLAVTSLSTLLILDGAQQQQLEVTAAELPVDLLNVNAAFNLFYQLLQRVDDKKLSPWQQEMITFMRDGFQHEVGEPMEER